MKRREREKAELFSVSSSILEMGQLQIQFLFETMITSMKYSCPFLGNYIDSISMHSI